MTDCPTSVDCRDWMTSSTVVPIAISTIPPASIAVSAVFRVGSETSSTSRSRNGEATEISDDAMISTATNSSRLLCSAKSWTMRRTSPGLPARGGVTSPLRVRESLVGSDRVGTGAGESAGAVTAGELVARVLIVVVEVVCGLRAWVSGAVIVMGAPFV